MCLNVYSPPNHQIPQGASEKLRDEDDGRLRDHYTSH